MFPGFRKEFDELLSDLEQISKDPKDVRDAEVHIDISKLYELRHEKILSQLYDCPIYKRKWLYIPCV